MKETEHYINRPFPIQLRGYFNQYALATDGSYIGNGSDSLAILPLLGKVNREISDEKEHLDMTGFREMLAGGRQPTPAQAQAIAMALTPEVNLYGDVRENFLEAARKPPQMHVRKAAGPALEDDEAAKEERIHKLSRTLGEHESRLQDHERQLAERRKQVMAWRSCNPKGCADKPSFPEMIEDAWREVDAAPGRKAMRFKKLLERVQQEWDISPENLCAHMEKLNRKKDIPKKTLTNSVIYQWINHPELLPNRESVLLLRETFGFDEQRELMLWKVIGGKVIEGLDEMLDHAAAAGKHGPVVKKLVESSGIPDIHIQKLVGVGQLPQWKRGATIEKKEAAKRFVDLVHIPENAADEQTLAQNQRILGLVTGRPQNFEKAIERASEAENPGGMLFLELTGRHGLVTLSETELASGLSVKGNKAKKIEPDTVTDHMVRKMRRSKHERGGFIHERHANAIIDMVAAKLKEEGNPVEITPGEREQCVEMMTGIANVKTLFALCRENELTAGELLHMTRDRRGLTQMAAEKQIGLASISEFERGKNILQHESARKVAKWLGLEGGDARDFVVMATGKQYDLTPKELLEQGKNPHQRCRALRRIFDTTGLTREELADKAGIDYSQIVYATQKRSGGHIVAPEEKVFELACLCGLKEQVGEFVSTFGSAWEDRVKVSPGKQKREV